MTSPTGITAAEADALAALLGDPKRNKMNGIIREAMLALCRKLEWSGEGRRYDDNSCAKVCPICHEPEPYEVDHGGWMAERGGHDELCELNALICALAMAE